MVLLLKVLYKLSSKELVAIPVIIDEKNLITLVHMAEDLTASRTTAINICQRLIPLYNSVLCVFCMPAAKFILDDSVNRGKTNFFIKFLDN